MSLTAIFDTARGPIRVELLPDQAPLTVANFVNLARRGFYDGLGFHRVIADFMVQGGCPEGSGRGGPGYRFEDETGNGVRHERGVLSMANAGPNTNGSQFFITHVATPWLDGKQMHQSAPAVRPFNAARMRSSSRSWPMNTRCASAQACCCWRSPPSV